MRYEVVAHNPSVETEFAGALVEAMQASLQAEDLVPVPCPTSLVGHRWEGVAPPRHPVLRFCTAAPAA